ncbi:MAG: sulfotransferase family 2 domain-containing protein [Rhodobiaceae bacterium]|nr:sulfotransferase family 2 domain-containing protein [Rhodobiaceae bacterium]MCC0055203.1 sulfotransferase family 2 domain-containing protein [Rhodobiaceae bacterium]
MRKLRNAELEQLRFIKEAAAFMPVGEVLYHIHVSKHLGYVFVETPKVACTTIKRALQVYEYERDGVAVPIFSKHSVHQRNLSPLLRINDSSLPKDVWSDRNIFKFCVVRNPYERLLSCYLSKIAVPGGPVKKLALSLKFGVSVESVEDVSQHIAFDDFVEIVGAQRSFDMNPHWRPQSDQTFQGLVEYNKICRFERLQDDLDAVAKALGIPDLLKLENAPNAFGASKQLHDFYNSRTASKVRQIYSRDFEIFGYPNELPA